jgi:Arc/MetJ-type ribon-helix-helix transcriptional regulator
MQISLTKPELEQFVEEQIKDGRFASASDLVEAAIARLMLDSDADEPFDDARLMSIRKSRDQIASGQVRPFAEAAEALRRKHIGR